MKKVLMASVMAFGLGMSGAAQAEIAIATAGPMTGQYASFGEQMRAGAEAAVRDINAAGGVLGEQLTLEVGDDACDPRQAVSVANQFAAQGVVFVAGHFCSGSSIPASAVYSEEGIVQISPASTNPALTDERPGPGVFRVCGRDDQQGAVAGTYIAETYPDARVAILHDKTAYGQGLAVETQAAYNAAGKTEVMFEAITAGEQDYNAIVSRMKAENIDIVYLGGYHTEAGLIVRQMREQGMDTVLISGDALVTNEYWAITGDAGEGTLMTFSPDPRANPAAADLVARFTADGVDPEGYVLYTYAAIQVWAQAVEAAGSTDYEAVAAAISGGTFPTVLGEFSFDENGDPVRTPERDYVFYNWHAGSYGQLQ
ncbi:MAG: branched-chain amino acid ABC transporter substrate-binding protein [Hyphomicrobiaceae bacterium]|nr:branched-chain amino acid ABC transporter substrate-binding protein [Hyphomicrobiaceae bacterium]